MNNKRIVLIASIVGIVIIVVILLVFVVTNSFDTSLNEEKCDTLLHKGAPWTVCYRDGEIVATSGYVNIYRADATKKYDFDKIEVFNKIGGSIVIATYEGKLYVGIKPQEKG